MCYTITTEYVCFHEIHEFHECEQDFSSHSLSADSWSEDDQEHELLKISRTRTRLCPKCLISPELQAQEKQFEFPKTTPEVNIPHLLHPGQPLFQRICEIAYNYWRTNKPFTVIIKRSIVDAAIDQIVEDHKMLNRPHTEPIPQPVRESLYLSICRELLFTASREKHSLTNPFQDDGDDSGSDTTQEEIITEAQIYNLGRALLSKNPTMTNRKIDLVINYAIDQVEDVGEQLSASEAEMLMRTLAFQTATCYQFPPSIHEARKIQANSIIDIVRDPNSKHFRDIPKATIRDIIEQSEMHIWFCSPRPSKSIERECLLNEIMKRLADWAKVQEDEWISDESTPLQSAKSRRPKLTLITS